MYYGGDYNPEQWPESVWPEDIVRMREAGVNMVTLGVFAWSRIQPDEFTFDFEWLDRIIELLHDAGIAVDLATATASPPPWASAKYPEILPADENGAVYWPGSRQHYAPSSAIYRRLAARLVTRLAERYGQHPAVVMWHVNNEYGCHLPQDFSDSARDAFRDWMRERYGTVNALNEAWGTWFWSQRYGSFEEIYPPRRAPYSHNPCQLLDFRRFTSDSMLDCFRMEKSIIRAAGAAQPVTTNFMGPFKPANYWQWASEMDVVSDDCYPDPNDPESFRTSAFAHDLMRSLKPDTPWILMEQSTSALNWRPSNASKAPGQMAALSMQAVARGADGIMFFQWRQSRTGAEKFHSAMLPHAGTGTRTWSEVVQLGADLGALPQLPVGPMDARVAIVFDWENWWAVENPDHPVELDYLAQVQRWYETFHRHNIQVDFVHPSAALDHYKLVVAPHLYLLRSTDAARLAGFVDRGGHLLVSAFSDVVDETDQFRPDGYLTQLGPVLGVTLEDFGALAIPCSAGPGPQSVGVRVGKETFEGSYFAEQIRATGAEVLARFTSGHNEGAPALTRSHAGAGQAWYLATVPEPDGIGIVVRHALEAAGVKPVLSNLPEPVEAIQRGNVLTVINHDDAPATIDISGTDLLAGEDVDKVLLGPFGFALVALPAGLPH